MRVAVVAPGAMGAAVAHRLHEGGAEVAVTLAGRGAVSAARAEGLAQQPSEAALAGWADVVLSILPPGEALELARRLAAPLRARDGAAVFVDCNAVSPETVREVETALDGVPFVDAGIIGGPPKKGGAGPKFYASGERAAGLAGLRDHGMDWRPIEGGIGAASALKMSYAGITKGLTALGSAMALGAARAGAADALLAELADSQPELLRYLRRSVPDMFGKAYRWVAEMEEISAFLKPNPAAPIYIGAARLYEAIAADAEKPQPEGAVAILRKFYAAT